jgi:hypothetical protein
MAFALWSGILLLLSGAIKWGDTNFAFPQLTRLSLRGPTLWPPPSEGLVAPGPRQLEHIELSSVRHSGLAKYQRVPCLRPRSTDR